MTILILVGMAVLVGVLLLYVFELGRSRRLLLKAGNARKALRGSERTVSFYYAKCPCFYSF